VFDRTGGKVAGLALFRILIAELQADAIRFE
jgi:hypothetical protein